MVVLFVQLAWSVQPVLSTWLWRSSPPLAYQPDAAAQPASLAAHARLYARGVGYPALLLLIEFVALAKALAADDPRMAVFGSIVAIASPPRRGDPRLPGVDAVRGPEAARGPAGRPVKRSSQSSPDATRPS